MVSNSYPQPSSSLPLTLSAIERREARYLLAISVRSTTDTDRIATGDLRTTLNVTAASVTEMVSRLDERGFVDYEKYRGVRLTDQGEGLAAAVGWRYCVVSTFFETVLEDAIDAETAFDIGFVMQSDTVFRLRELADSACLGLCPDSNGDGERCVA